MAWSCATWFREPCQVRKEAAVSGVPGAPQPTEPEWSALRARAEAQREGVRGQPTDSASNRQVESVKDARFVARVVAGRVPFANAKGNIA